MDAILSTLFALQHDELGLAQPWGLVGRTKTASGSGVSIGSTLDLPDRGILAVTHAMVVGTPGATQAVTALSLQFTEPCLGGDHLVLWENTTGTADQFEAATMAPGFVVPLSSDLTATFAGTFDAGVASNSVTVYLQGLWLPQGNGGWR